MKKLNNARYKASVISFVLVVLLSSFSVSAHADTFLGNLSHWNSDASKISKWLNHSYYNISAITTYSSNSTFNSYFTSGMINARDEWDSALNTLTVVSGFDSPTATFKFYAGSRSEILSLGLYGINSLSLTTNKLGLTYIYTEGYLGYYTYSGSNKTATELLSVYGCIVSDLMSNNQTMVKAVALHEVGHAFGWIGHSSVSSDAMYAYPSSTTSLTTSDKQHLSQIY